MYLLVIPATCVTATKTGEAQGLRAKRRNFNPAEKTLLVIPFINLHVAIGEETCPHKPQKKSP
jgi:hypothetical protein